MNASCLAVCWNDSNCQLTPPYLNVHHMSGVVFTMRYLHIYVAGLLYSWLGTPTPYEVQRLQRGLREV